ncbi:hypothetical protein [Akkermansia muciniphila]|uniref:hypothetical protein n=1 Tax=Akkermansia muciniphila TaxID=239935 RepID=UPI001CA529FE|nr:hypothetical protein [Akkermansia muciniphila]
MAKESPLTPARPHNVMVPTLFSFTQVPSPFIPQFEMELLLPPAYIPFCRPFTLSRSSCPDVLAIVAVCDTLCDSGSSATIVAAWADIIHTQLANKT